MSTKHNIENILDNRTEMQKRIDKMVSGTTEELKDRYIEYGNGLIYDEEKFKTYKTTMVDLHSTFSDMNKRVGREHDFEGRLSDVNSFNSNDFKNEYNSLEGVNKLLNMSRKDFVDITNKDYFANNKVEHFDLSNESYKPKEVKAATTTA